MYTLVPPLRADYFNVKIVEMDSDGTLEEAASGPDDRNGSYVAYSVTNPAASYIHIAKPTKVGGYQRHGITTAVPWELQKTILASLEARPRTHLFTMARSNQPYGRKYFDAWAVRTLRSCLGHSHIQIQHLRRSFVVALYQKYAGALAGDEGDHAKQQAEEHVRRAAHCMGHSLDMHSKYRFTLNDDDVPEQLQLTNIKLSVLPRKEREVAVVVEPL
jgi:hypothetical protein